MASQVCENLAFINGHDEVKGMEFFQINGALLTTLMEESPCDESHFDDRLDSIIRSLEAEINISTTDGSDSASMESESVSNVEDFGQSWSMGQMDGQDFWAPCDCEMEWVGMDVMPSSPSDQGSWCIDSYGDEMDGINEFFEVGSNLKMNSGYDNHLEREL